MVFHVTAHAAAARRPLSDADACWALWWRLRRMFEHVLAACLMPDHLHVLVHAASADALRRLVGYQLGAFARELGAGPQWQPVPPPLPVLGDDKLERQMRYALLNPVRAGFVGDPASWLWSTHRDVIGARADPWVTPVELAVALGRPDEGFVEWFHRYVSSDPSVAVDGSPLPLLATGGTLDEIARAVSCAATEDVTRRRLFALVAAHVGHPRRVIAAELGISPDTVTRWTRRPAPELLRAGLLCLGDERLRTAPRFRRLRAA
jgi:hypothetical protein